MVRWSLASAGSIWLAALALGACSPAGPEDRSTGDVGATTASEAASDAPVIEFAEAASQLQTLAIRVSDELISRCNELSRRVHAFLESPDESGRDAARDAYHGCYEQWRRYRLFQQVPFSLKDRDGFERTVKLIDTRPFQPGYIDALPEYPYSGLVFETGLELSLSTLLDQHRMMDEESAALGFPVIETLLWRDPLPAVWLEQPADAEEDLSAVPRRRQYLSLATDDLMVRLKASTQRWRPGQGYSALPQAAQRRIIWESAHNLVLADLMEAGFSEAALSDPDWHHPSVLAGQGLRHWLAMLDGLSMLFNRDGESPAPLGAWMDAAGIEPTATALAQRITAARDALAALPANYPAQGSADEIWRRARQALEQLADDLAQAGQHSGLTIRAPAEDR